MFYMVKMSFKNYTKDMVIIILLSVINSLTAGVGVVMLIPMLNIINVSGSDIGIFSFALTLFSGVPYAWRVAILLLVYMGVILITSVIARFMAIYNTKFVQKYVKELRLQVYDAVIDTNWEVLAAQRHDDLLNSFTNETAKISTAMMIFPTLVSMIISAGTQILIALALNVPLTMIVIVFGSIFFFAFRKYFDIAKKNGERMRVANRKYLGEIRSQLESIKEIKSYGVEADHREFLQDILDEYETANVRRTRMATLPTLLFSMSSTVLIAIIFYIANVILKVEMIELILIVYIFARIWPVFSKFHRQMIMLNNALPSFESVDRTLSVLNASVKEKESGEGSIDLKREIAFKNVTFAYASSNEKVLDHLSLTIKAHAITALKGESGVGKSTIVNLLMGLLKPVDGAILVDDLVLTNDNIRAWRKSIGYMPQDPIILNRSIRENITRFNPGATEEEIFMALEKSQALSFVHKLPEGLDTLMGHKGVRLSGGEKQRIVLARALVRNPSVLILDEATSALDHENERNIQETIQSLKESMTIVSIAHRQSTIDGADYVIQLNNDGILEVSENNK
jgi:ATP-binding cassette subfamily C protein